MPNVNENGNISKFYSFQSKSNNDIEMTLPSAVQTASLYESFTQVSKWATSTPRILKSKLPESEIPNLTFSEYVYGHLVKHTDKPFLTDSTTGKVLTFVEVADLSRRVASALLRLPNYERGKVACIFSSNCPEFLIAMLGASASGMVPALINPNLTAQEAKRHLAEIETDILFVSQETEERALEAVKNLPHVRNVFTFDEPDGKQTENGISFSTLTRDNGCGLTKLPSASDYESDLRDVTGIMLFSSGTSGLPKCVVLSHYTIIANLCNSNKHPEIALYAEGNVILCVLPLAHAYASLALTIPCLIRGIQVVLQRKYTFDGALEAIEKYKVTCFPLVPPIAIRLLQDFESICSKHDLSSLTDILCAAAPIGAEFEDALKKKFKLQRFRQLYGMTENSPLISTSPLNYHRSGSVGRLCPGNEMKVADLETEELLGPYERGEIWVRGPHVFKGYLNNDEATREMITSDGWMKTGDIGYYDDEDFLYLVDRKKEIIRYKCTQVAPAELEALLLGHPDIEDVAVVGIPDPLAGELPRAYVVRCRTDSESRKKSVDDEKFTRSIETEDDVCKFVQENAAAFKHLRGGVEFVDSIPKSPTGKILRRVLRQRYLMENRRNSLKL